MTIPIPSGVGTPSYDAAGRRYSRAVYVLGGALTVLVAAWFWLVVEHGTLRLWDVVVHESGQYTLGQTVLYFRHFLREVPTLFTIALFAIAAYGVPLVPPDERPRARRRARWYALAGLLGAGLMFVVAFSSVRQEYGTVSALLNLMQYHTRDYLVSYGSHWRFHWLSTLWLGLATSLCARVAARWLGAPAPSDTRGGGILTAVAWGWFLGLSLVFVPSTEPFLDPRYIGHQAREILTHSLVTLPVGLGLLAMCLRAHGCGEPRSGVAVPISLTCLAAVFVIPIYLGLATVLGGAIAHGQTAGGLAAMVAAHFFEHVLDYLFVALLCSGGYGLLLARASGRSLARRGT